MEEYKQQWPQNGDTIKWDCDWYTVSNLTGDRLKADLTLTKCFIDDRSHVADIGRTWRMYPIGEPSPCSWRIEEDDFTLWVREVRNGHFG